MLRLLLIIVLVVYALYKLGLFRIFAVNVRQDQDKINRRPPGSNVDIDSKPPRAKGSGDFKGGEYVDYEDVKE